MRLIIDNDNYNLYARTDYALSEQTLLDGDASGQSLKVLNATGFSNGDYLVIEPIGQPRAEITQVNTITGTTFSLANSLSFTHDNKTKVSKLNYNLVNFYEDNTLITSVAINPSYYTVAQKAIDGNKTYSISYKNGSLETPRGEKLNGWEYNLCSLSDILQYEAGQEVLSRTIIDKIDIASRELRAKFVSQDQNFTDLSERDIARLREPTALRTLYYIFNELIKNKDDVNSLKANAYLGLYEAKLSEVMETITKQNTKVQIFGQTRAIR